MFTCIQEGHVEKDVKSEGHVEKDVKSKNGWPRVKQVVQ